VIYSFYSESAPLLAPEIYAKLDIYAKNDREELTGDQKKRFRLIAEGFAKAHRRRR
jgi:hypothetical protein